MRVDYFRDYNFADFEEIEARAKSAAVEQDTPDAIALGRRTPHYPHMCGALQAEYRHLRERYEELLALAVQLNIRADALEYAVEGELDEDDCEGYAGWGRIYRAAAIHGRTIGAGRRPAPGPRDPEELEEAYK
jgi:hypothetical protein